MQALISRVVRSRVALSIIGISLICSVLLFLGYIAIIKTTETPTENTTPLVLTNPGMTTHIVTLTENGFEPESLVIRQNEKVLFTTDQNAPFWPASSLHPTHEIYSEFDPKDRIIPPDNWEFEFTRIGEWKYHDHINAHKTGVITVIDPSQEMTLSDVRVTNCSEAQEYEKQQCWDNLLQTVLKEDGLEAAFAFFVELYQTEPDVPKACHEWGHSLGEASYELYKETGDLVLVPEASYCGYGYFHSFIASLVKDTGDLEDVLQFCTDVEEALKDELTNIASNCIHGVGHGTTAWLLEDPENWGKFQKTADEGTAICERIYTNEEDLEDCYDGVYNELHLDLFNNLYGLDFAAFMEKDDPFWICNEQQDRHKRSCYFEFVGIFWSIFDLDLNRALEYIVNNIDDIERNGPTVIAKIAADWIQFDIVKESQERNIEGCRSLPTFLFRSCIQGIANGFIQHGEPNNLHPKGFAFCGASYLQEDERTLCFEIFLNMLLWNYTSEQFVQACTQVPKEYHIPQCSA